MKENFYHSLKTVIKGGIFILFGMLFAKISGFLRQFVIVHILMPDQYGLFSIGFSILNICSTLGNLGISIGARRLIAFYEAKNELQKVKSIISSSIKLVIISGTTINLLLILTSNHIASFFSKPEFVTPLIIFSLIVPCSITNNLFASIFYGFKHPELAEFINSFAFGFLSVAFICIALIIRKTLFFAMIGLLLSYFVIFLLNLKFFKNRIFPKVASYKASTMNKELLFFSLPLLLTNIGYIILNYTDTLMLGYFTTSENVGFYNAAFVLSSFIAVFLNALGIIVIPVFANLVAIEKRRDIVKLYQTITRWLFIFTLPLLLTFIFLPSQVLDLVFSKPYTQAGFCLVVLSISEFQNTFLGPNYQTLIALGESTILLISWSTAAVSNIIMNYFFIKKWGINGAAMATGISLAILNFINSIFLYRRHGIHPFGKKYILPVFACFGASAILYLPLRALVNRSNWFVLVCYPLFLLLGIIFTLLTRSVTEEDKLIYAALKSRIRELLKR